MKIVIFILRGILWIVIILLAAVVGVFLGALFGLFMGPIKIIEWAESTIEFSNRDKI